MRKSVIKSWGRILTGRNPILSIEITGECPLACPGCYAYAPRHLGDDVTLRDVSELRGPALVQRVCQLVRLHRPLHVAFVGGEPLVRRRELSEILPQLSAQGIDTQVVTSAVGPVPPEWAEVKRLRVSVSVDGLQPEHDARRKPATYDRILEHIEGHRVTIHCTVTGQQAGQPGYLEEFVRFWSAVPETKHIWVSLYTPQLGETSPERLTAEQRRHVVADLLRLRGRFPKLETPPAALKSYLEPPGSPARCKFAKVSTCLSPDLETPVTPCQIGGSPDCSECGCYAAAGFEAIGRYRLPIGVRAGTVCEWSLGVGAMVRRLRAATGRDRLSDSPRPGHLPVRRSASADVGRSRQLPLTRGQ
jgi:MoaA/NifB/PqqE/SkfB family radical SAM enzyme